MKTHIIWFCITVAALIVGTQFARKEVRIVEKPAEITTTKEVFVEKPVKVIKKVPKGAEGIVVDRKTTPPAIASRASPAERQKLHQRYDPFLIQLGLTPAQMDRFVELKLAIYEAQNDLQAAVEQNGVQGGTAGVEALRSNLTKPMWDEIRELLGTEGVKAYADYEHTSAVRPTVVGLFQGSGVAVSDEQTDQVTRLVIKHTQTYRVKPTDISSRRQIDWNAVAREAESILTSAQIDVIRAKAAREPRR